ncbi:hypothetical protein ACFW04_014161 [Cataglyphis niger]
MIAYTNEEYYDMLMALGECHGQYHVAARRYAESYPNRIKHLSVGGILRAAQRLYETGSILSNKHDTGRYRDVRNLENTEHIINVFEHNEPEMSIRLVAREHNLSSATIQRILKEENLHAFHYTRVQHLRREDYHARRMFCEDFLRKVDRNPRFLSRVIFSDESLFTREGIFNSHNMHFCSEENPRVTRFRNFLEEVPLIERNKIAFQQDDAGPHNARIVTNYLNEQFPGRWMGRYGPIRWPARSLNLNPLDFFFMGIL